jgi:hypothetical protein
MAMDVSKLRAQLVLELRADRSDGAVESAIDRWERRLAELHVNHTGNHTDGSLHHVGGHSTAHTAMIFPLVAITGGCAIAHLTSRYLRGWLPYSPMMLIFGVLLTVVDHELLLRNAWTEGGLHESLQRWTSIDGHLLLTLFLPPLLFADAIGLDWHVAFRSLSQCLILAFPGVVLGACLTAAFAVGVLPYGWDWTLALSFGAVLAATDPVAVVSPPLHRRHRPRGVCSPSCIHAAAAATAAPRTARTAPTALTASRLRARASRCVAMRAPWGAGLAAQGARRACFAHNAHRRRVDAQRRIGHRTSLTLTLPLTLSPDPNLRRVDAQQRVGRRTSATAPIPRPPLLPCTHPHAGHFTVLVDGACTRPPCIQCTRS